MGNLEEMDGVEKKESTPKFLQSEFDPRDPSPITSKRLGWQIQRRHRVSFYCRSCARLHAH
jgi:hypothetical protein